MKRPFLSQDMLLLKWPLLLMVSSVMVSVLWWGGAYKFREDSVFAMQAAQAKRAQLETVTRQVEEEEKTIRSHSGRYRQLQTSGVIGEEERLELVEALGRIRVRYNLYPLEFDIGQQTVIPLQEGEPENGEPSLSLRASRIQIALPLLHEEDLSRLLDELRNIGSGMFVVEECSLSRAGSAAESDILKLSANLTASCNILWLTLKAEDRVAPPPEEPGS